MKRSVAAVVVSLFVVPLLAGSLWSAPLFGQGAAVGRYVRAAAKRPAIAWHSYSEGLQLARRQHKVALVDVMATWCGWCKKLDTNVYTDPSIIALSDRVVFIKVDGDKQVDVKSKYRVTGYPTIILLKNGKEAGRIVGYEEAPKFLADVEKVAGKSPRHAPAKHA